MKFFALILSFFLSPLAIAQAQADISGNISINNSTVQQTGVTYTFDLQIQNTISASGKITIHFPPEFTSSFTTNCKPISGFSQQSLTCTYSKTTRLLTLTGSAFPTNKQTLTFQVNGVTNPPSVVTTSFFNVALYALSGQESYELIQSGSKGFQITTVAGLIHQKSLKLSNPTVGVLSVLTVQFFSPHNIPANGRIQLTLPKWNKFDPDQAAQVSMIAVSVSPGFVECAPQLGLVSPLTTCYLNQSETNDIFTIYLNEAAAVAAGRQISVLVQGVRAPPSQQVITGFTLQTTTSDGHMIDYGFNPGSITLAATIPVLGAATQVNLTAENTTIFAVTTLTIAYQNINPLRPGATLTITIPDDFNIAERELELKVWGQSVNSFAIFNVDNVRRTITIQRFNDEYMQSFSTTFFNISGVVNPSSTNRTGEFKIQISDSNFKQIEYINQGVTFQATPNGFNLVNFTTDNTNINTADANYTFNLIPKNSFQSQASLKLEFPSQIQVAPNANISEVSANMNADATIQVELRSFVTLTNAFPDGYNQGDIIKFTISGVHNPNMVGQTDQISVKIFYTEFKSEINLYHGPNMTLTATPSPSLQMSVLAPKNQTGAIESEIQITGFLPKGQQIQIGSFLLVLIPFQFQIPNFQRTSQSCISLGGFTGNIICSVEKTQKGFELKVKGGFSTAVFQGGYFSFSISGIDNPMTTAQTDKFSMIVHDFNDRTQYYISDLDVPVTLQMVPSEFKATSVACVNCTNGAITDYLFYFTLTVSTPTGNYLNVTLPADSSIILTQDVHCSGLVMLAQNLNCNFDGKDTIQFQLYASDQSIAYFASGTTLAFQIGNFKNPTSFATSSSFSVTTFGKSAQSEFLISSQTQNFQIKTNNQSSITITNLEQSVSSQLNQITSLNFQIDTELQIPIGSTISTKLPQNIAFTGDLIVSLNGQPIYTFDVTSEIQTVLIPISENGQSSFNISIGGGIRNPAIGPYTYMGFDFKISDIAGYPIAKSSQISSSINVECSQNCQTCGLDLATCLSCGFNQATNIYFSQLGTSCVESCPPGMFLDSQNQCQICSDECQECSLSATMCTKCDPTINKYLIDRVSSVCLITCPSGTYLDSVGSQCLACVAPCLTCISATQCQSCKPLHKDNTTLYFQASTNSCIDKCNSNQLASPSNLCQYCEFPCTSCTGQPENCLTCEKGLYLFGIDCVSRCPYNFFQDNTVMQCKQIARVAVPFPFSILAAVLAIGVFISSIMIKKNNPQYVNAFFVTMLAFVDVLLRLNWVTLAIVAAYESEFRTMIWCVVLLSISICLNLFAWRRYFKFKFDMERKDDSFLAYTAKYPKTSKTILVLSYSITFQSIRLVYCNLLSMKQLSGTFDRKRVYYIIIARATLLEIVTLFIPALAMNIYGLAVHVPNQQLYYIGVDSLTLIILAMVLIVVTFAQQEQILSSDQIISLRELFDWRLNIEDKIIHQRQTNKVSNIVEESCQEETLGEEEGIQLEMMSANNFEGIKSRNYRLYQPQCRQYGSQNLVYNKPLEESGQIQNFVELSIELSTKLEKVKLKKVLFENKRVSDYRKVQQLSENLYEEFQVSNSLHLKLDQLKIKLQQIQANIEFTTKIKEETIKAIKEQKKEQISERKITSETSQQQRGFSSYHTSNKKRQLSEEPYLAISELPPVPKPPQKQKRAKSQGRKKAKKLKLKLVIAPESPGDKFTIEEIYQFSPAKGVKSNALNPFL